MHVKKKDCQKNPKSAVLFAKLAAFLIVYHLTNQGIMVKELVHF